MTKENCRDTGLREENDNLKKFNSYLISHLSKYEEVISYNDFVNKFYRGEIDIDQNDDEESSSESHKFVGPDDDEFHKIVKKIGEGATSEVFKVRDERTGEVICKKVIKETEDDKKFKTLKNAMKEICTSQSIRHPCICESLGYNIQEPMQGQDNDDKTTVALFMEYLPYSVKEMSKNGLLNNTMKVRIALETAFGMSYIHSLGMMHRDLKLENIMMNSVFDSKIIDFGLVYADEMSFTGSSLTRGIGTLAYMSPEMLNEEEYDNKTDVYSYGVILFALFTGNLPKQSMRDKLNNVGMKYPKESDEISEYCIRLIKRCMSFKASDRPTFDEIIDDMFVHKFLLTSEVNVKAIKRRFHELNRIRSQHLKKQNKNKDKRKKSKK